MTDTYSFGEWLKQRRKQLRFTQKALAAEAFCSTAMIKKIEADERQPSPELAEALAAVLQLPPEQHPLFISCARGEKPVDYLAKVQESGGAEGQRSRGEEKGFVPSLPTPATAFIGRKTELADITIKLRQPECRLLTLLGPGGMGKTRLAIEAARQLQAYFAHGAVFVDLTAVTDPTLVPDSIARALKLALSGSAVKHLPHVLRHRQLLIILDNCEQLTAGLTWLSTLLAAAPQVTLLVTSRERLQLAEEWVVPVAGLDAAVELFEQTASRLTPTFDPHKEETAVNQICQLIENHPLAIELAASWTPYLSCAQIAAHLQKDLEILETTVRNAPARHRSIQAVFDHSWQLLSAAEQSALMRLSVFRGGSRPEEAQAVAGANLFLLRGLAEKSLVRVRAHGRFDLHELTRQYAAVQLQAAGAEAATRQQHADTFFALAQRFEQDKATPEGPALFQRLHQGLDNIQAALQWLLDSGQANQALQFAGKLGEFWFWGGYRLEGAHWIETILTHSDQADSRARCEALLAIIPLLTFIGRQQDALAYTAQTKAMAYRLEETMLLIRVLAITSQNLDRDEGKAAVAEALRLFDSVEEENGFIGAVYMLYGDLLRETGEYAAAKECYQKADEVGRRYGVLIFGGHEGNLGRLALQEGHLSEAHALISENVQKTRQLNNQKGLADWLVRLGEIETYLGQLEAAHTHLQECFQLMETMGDLSGQADVSAGLGYLALQRGEVETAVSHLQNSFHWYAELIPPTAGLKSRALTPELVDAILRAGLVAAAHQQPAQAATLFTAVTRFGAAINHTPPPPLAQAMNGALPAVQAALSTATYQTATTLGRERSLHELLKQTWA